MQHIESALGTIRQGAFLMGVPELAKRAGVHPDTIHRLLKAPPDVVLKLMKLEALCAAEIDRKNAELQAQAQVTT